jgi:hypothetical protein
VSDPGSSPFDATVFVRERVAVFVPRLDRLVRPPDFFPPARFARGFGTSAFASSSESSAPSADHALPQDVHRVVLPRALTTRPWHDGQGSGIGCWLMLKSHSG